MPLTLQFMENMSIDELNEMMNLIDREIHRRRRNVFKAAAENVLKAINEFKSVGGEIVTEDDCGEEVELYEFSIEYDTCGTIHAYRM